MDRKMHFPLLAGAALVAAVSPAFAEVQQQVKQVPSGYVNVRSGPGTNYTDIGDIPSGTVLSVLGYDPSGQWAIINWQGQIAYVARSLLQDVAAAPVVHDELGPHRVSGIPPNDPDGGLVVRTGPGTNFGAIRVLPSGTEVDIVEVSPDRKWSRAVFSDGASGWMRNSYLSPEAPADTPPAPQPGHTYVITTPATPVQVFEFPNDTAPVLTQLDPNTPVAVLEPLHMDWVKVSIAGQEGYMHASGTMPGGGVTTSEGMQLGLSCAGTEPFWTFQIGTDGTTAFEDVGSQGTPIMAPLTSVSGNAYPYSFQAGQISGQLSNTVCSDGMSDITYPWELLLNVTSGGGSQTLQGCCLLQ